MDVPGAVWIYQRTESLGKSLMPDPERASIVRRIFEEYETGRFTKQQMLQPATAWA
jgi:hypothetical protein